MSARALARRLRPALQALRGFLRGFLGLAGSDPVYPSDSAAARRALEERAARRPTCC